MAKIAKNVKNCKMIKNAKKCQKWQKCQNDTTKPTAISHFFKNAKNGKKCKNDKKLKKIAKMQNVLLCEGRFALDIPIFRTRRQFWAPAEKFLALKIGAGIDFGSYRSITFALTVTTLETHTSSAEIYPGAGARWVLGPVLKNLLNIWCKLDSGFLDTTCIFKM